MKSKKYYLIYKISEFWHLRSFKSLLEVPEFVKNPFICEYQILEDESDYGKRS